KPCSIDDKVEFSVSIEVSDGPPSKITSRQGSGARGSEVRQAIVQQYLVRARIKENQILVPIRVQVASENFPGHSARYRHVVYHRRGKSAILVAKLDRHLHGIGSVRSIKSNEVASPIAVRSEEHTSELQSRGHFVCRLLLEKKKA